jgi:hypothetical protein
MEINTVGQLKNLIKDLDDDFKLDINIMTLVPPEELIKSPYPWSREDGRIEFHDIGYSDKVICFGVFKKN